MYGGSTPQSVVSLPQLLENPMSRLSLLVPVDS